MVTDEVVRHLQPEVVPRNMVAEVEFSARRDWDDPTAEVELDFEFTGPMVTRTWCQRFGQVGGAGGHGTVLASKVFTTSVRRCGQKTKQASRPFVVSCE